MTVAPPPTTRTSTPPRPDPGRRGRVALAVAEAVDRVDGVRRTAGPGVGVATQYRGGQAVGVGLSDDGVTVHVEVLHIRLAVVVDAVHVAVRQALDGIGDRRPVSVIVDDLDLGDLQLVKR
jgi:hypothetical protein